MTWTQPEQSGPDQTKWTGPKRLVLDQNDLTVQNYLEPIEGQGCKNFFKFDPKISK